MTPTVYILAANVYTLAALALIALRAVGRIPWPWWAVTAPLWGPCVVSVGVLLLLGMTLGLEWLFERMQHYERV